MSLQGVLRRPNGPVLRAGTAAAIASCLMVASPATSAPKPSPIDTTYCDKLMVLLGYGANTPRFRRSLCASKREYLKAAREGKTKELHLFLDMGMPVDTADESNQTALMLSVENWYCFRVCPTAVLLLKSGASPKKADQDGDTPLSVTEKGVCIGSDKYAPADTDYPAECRGPGLGEALEDGEQAQNYPDFHGVRNFTYKPALARIMKKYTRKGAR